MANYWMIGIGINQYRFLPPLSYAQRDVELLYQILIQSGFSPRHCRLLTDHITVTSSDPSFPTAQNIQTQLAYYQKTVKPGDVLLCFFSGYGLQIQGKDYLLPIEGDPRQAATTGISIELLIKTLKAIPTQNLILLLDANRSQLGLDLGGFGEQTTQLAKEAGIATLLSCQPNQFSHEPLTLRQGIFTAALATLLQANGCMTLEQLVSVLSEQLPRMSEEFWRPRQDLLAILPSHLRYQLVMPEPSKGRSAATRGTWWSEPGLPLEPASPPARAIGASLSKQFTFLSETGSSVVQKATDWLATVTKPRNQPTAMVTDSGSIAAIAPLEQTELDSSEGDMIALTDEYFWRRLLVQGGLIASILLFGVILRNSSALIHSANRNSDHSSTATAVSQSPVASSPQTSSQPPDTSSGPTDELIIAIDPALQMQSAQTAFQARQYEDANRQLSQIPAAQRSPEHNQLLEQINRELLNKAKTMLIRTREPRSENQVSDLVEAIKVGRLIKSDQPLYEEAQQNIERWSRVIMDMAQGRAARSNDSSVLDAANNYNMAISSARLVPTDQVKVHAQAEQAVALWSQKILDLANARATNGELDLAIQIGELIPPNTEVYVSAQEAIASWRNQPAPVVEKEPAQPYSIEPESTESESQSAESQSAESQPVEGESEY